MRRKPPIAIVGMAGVFPGAGDVHQYWHNIIGKLDASADMPSDRWILDPGRVVDPTGKPDKAFHRKACLISDFPFNPSKFNIDPAFLNGLDPLHRLVLHCGHATLDKVKPNQNTGRLPKEKTGVILAAIALPTDTASAFSRSVLAGAMTSKGWKGEKTAIPLSDINELGTRVTSFPAALLAQALGLGGGTYTLDAACASSLFSIKLACDELISRRADLMLAGGVSRPDCLYTQIGFSQLKALSPSGRCAPFDAAADGLIVGEGCGILALKRLEDALTDGDEILGVIRGIGLSNDIGGNLLAPDGEGQLRAMRRAYSEADWSPRDIDFIECHGAGTPVGDATELQSLKSLWGHSGWEKHQCAIGSVKSMIGHLLTAAGAAGLIKVLLALKHGLMPPTLNHRTPSTGSPLQDGPFRVLTDTVPWDRRDPGTPRRAAVSAFGFGGINAHLLIEEWCNEEAASPSPEISSLADKTQQPIAVIGMAATLGPLKTLREFQEALFKGESAFIQRPAHRWKGMDAFGTSLFGEAAVKGAYVDAVSVEMGRFHIPPNEIPDIIPQHLLMLKTAADALKDAGLPPREDRPNMGVVIGMGFDMEETNYHLRWSVASSGVAEETVMDGFAPPLTSSRVLGALGSMVASRIAKEFRLGAPGFVVSCEEASGIKALEIGIRWLELGEVDAMLVGAVDLTGDLRQMILNNRQRPYSKNNRPLSFDYQADGTVPGEGAAALVLKRLDAAVADGDRIYAVINGIGGAAGQPDLKGLSSEAFNRSLETVLEEIGLPPGIDPLSQIDLFELPGYGDAITDRTEGEALNSFPLHHLNTSGSDRTAIGTLTPMTGYTGAVSGLASVVKTCLSLYQEILPVSAGFVKPPQGIWDEHRFFFPAYSQYWVKNREDGPRRACVSSFTTDGNCMQVFLSEHSTNSSGKMPEMSENRYRREKSRPLGDLPFGLFVVSGDNNEVLLSEIEKLSEEIGQMESAGFSIDAAGQHWYRKAKQPFAGGRFLSLVAANFAFLKNSLQEAKAALFSHTARTFSRFGGLHFSPEPAGQSGEIAFVFPGSGNHWVGMGRETSLRWPEVPRSMNEKTGKLKHQMLPQVYIPQRLSWREGWETEALDHLSRDPLHMIFGQVMFGGMMSDLVRRFKVQPSAVIGYSLGETAGNFALGLWKDRGDMLDRMRKTDLFSTQLSGPCSAGRNAWGIDDSAPFDWYVAAVNRPAETVRQVIKPFTHVRLLIVNTPDECVIGGLKPEVLAVIRELGCEAVYIEGVVTVHCDALTPVTAAYRELHYFPTFPPEGISFYSCALGDRHLPTSERAAQSIVDQACFGFDFPKTILKAYEDGVRVFIEIGPHNSCTRMIDRILDGKPHLAVSASSRAEQEVLSLLKCLAVLIAEGVPVGLDYLYGESAFPPPVEKDSEISPERRLVRMVGDVIQIASPPKPEENRPIAESKPFPLRVETSDPTVRGSKEDRTTSVLPWDILAPFEKQTTATAEAHNKFLDFSRDLTRTYAETYAYQMRLLEALMSENPQLIESGAKIEPFSPDFRPVTQESQRPIPVFSREMCLEFAIGSAEKVLGPLFAPVDTYRARVRLPDEPLMLVDRIMSIEATKGVLGPGKLVTEHDVLPDAWYLDGGRAPVCISVEAGQADLFLCAYMGIDLKVRGERTYRLLDATVDFFRGLPKPGETIRYAIEIERFARQGETYLFFFHFDGYIGEERLIRMRNGCAGFFTEEEVRNSGGIIFTEAERAPRPGKVPPDWRPPVPMKLEHYDEAAVNRLREGDLAACFGPAFSGKSLSESLRLPGGRMSLIHRVLNLEPTGGRYGIGRIRAEADIHPGDWFLTCHFVDDMVMPGTLMYECCAHTLRVFVQRLGWISDKPDACYEPVIGIRSRLKCRGPVTPRTRKVIYEIEIKEIGFGPEPYVIADAHMHADGHHIVYFEDMTLKLSHVTAEEIETFWCKTGTTIEKPAIVFNTAQVLAFAEGKPSAAFGSPYRAFDTGRFIARLPRPPYSFMHRVISAEPAPWELKPDGWIEAEYDVPPEAWYFIANRTPTLPIAVLLEIALQPCGWLAAYAGSALKSEKDLRFRNLGGKAELLRDVTPAGKTLTTRARLTKVSAAGDMIIEFFDFEVLHEGNIFYRGSTNFGFFSLESLSAQVGLGKTFLYNKDSAVAATPPTVFPELSPFHPDEYRPGTRLDPGLELPGKALLMIDRIERYHPLGGPEGLGYVRGEKLVNPEEWFFTAHFYQDPVCPGSLGIESFIQLLRFDAMNRWPHLKSTHRIELVPEAVHEWIYRGQITPACKTVTVEAMITAVSESPFPTLTANGYLHVDGLCIYQMNDFGIRLVPII